MPGARESDRASSFVNRLLRLIPLAAASLLLAVVATPAAALEVGMGDQRSRMFADPRFQQLDITRVRIVVDWDVALVDGPERARLDEWLATARTTGREPLIAFTDSRGRPRYLPAVSEYEQAFVAFAERYPWVRLYTTWNEANLASQPTAKSPERVAGYYDLIRSRCADCTVVAGDVLDQGGMIAWIERVRQAAASEPTLWGVHNYVEVHRPERAGTTARLLASVPGRVWLTETGGIVSHVLANGRVGWAYDERRAATAVARAFKVARSDPRIERIYLYQWSVDSYERWDSAFMGPRGDERPALEVLRAELGGTAARLHCMRWRPRGALSMPCTR